MAKNRSTSARSGHEPAFQERILELTGGLDTNAIVAAPRPEWLPIPTVGKREHYTGLSRAAIYKAIRGRNPAVKSALVRRPGYISGRRLVNLASLLAYCDGMIQSPAGGPGANPMVEETRNE